MIKRQIGVDFGTTTSVIHYVDYDESGKIIRDLDVLFEDSNNPTVPTMILLAGEKKDKRGRTIKNDECYGWNAYNKSEWHEFLQSEFKIGLLSQDEEIRTQSKQLTQKFFRFLYQQYDGAKEKAKGEQVTTVTTYVTYPGQFHSIRNFLRQAAEDAGFPNVQMLTEAEAAMYYTLNIDTSKKEEVFDQFKEHKINVMLADLGGGTTDIAIYSYDLTGNHDHKLLGFYPKDGEKRFGGSKVDDLLCDFFHNEAFEQTGQNVELILGKKDSAFGRRLLKKAVKEWKETTLAPNLDDPDCCEETSPGNLNWLNLDIEIDRAALEQDILQNYLPIFSELINGALSDTKQSGTELSGKDIDVVMLTGGHSRWYFVKDMLLGKRGTIDLPKIKQSEGKRIITFDTNAQMVVARGSARYKKAAPPPPPPKPPVSKVPPKPNIEVKPSVFPLKYDPYSRIRPVIACGVNHTVGLKEDGTVIATGDKFMGQCNVSAWRSIVAISAGSNHTVGLRKDGTVVAVGDSGDVLCNVNDWCDIVAISAGAHHTVGLKKDGTVVAVGNVGDKLFGRKYKVKGWRDIVAISAGVDHTVGLKKDGTVVAVGDKTWGQCKVEGWHDIVAISAGTRHTIGLKKDGTVVAAGDDAWDKCKVGGWHDIVAIAAGDLYTIGLKRDGTVIAVGCNSSGECNVNDWHDIVAISAGDCHTIGLRKDGTVTATGLNHYGQTNVGKYKTSGGLFGLFSKTTEQTPWKLF